MASVFVEGQRFFGHHGWTDEEQTVGTWFVASVSAEVPGPFASDDLDGSADYGSLAEAVAQANASSRFRTVEALAAAIAKIVFKACHNVSSVEVTVKKIAPPFSHTVDSAGCRCVFTRP